MKPLVLILAALGFLTAAAQNAALNTSCPMDGKPAVAAHQTLYSKTAALCCNKCKAQFDATPKSWLNAILTAHAGQCPMSKKAITSPVNVTYKRQVAFCSGDCKSKFTAAPDKHIKDVR